MWEPFLTSSEYDIKNLVLSLKSDFEKNWYTITQNDNNLNMVLIAKKNNEVVDINIQDNIPFEYKQLLSGKTMINIYLRLEWEK